jgi:putative Mg2+ transporter-C (MgtC) family protein
MVLAYFGQPVGQGWTQIGELAIALALSTAIGVEREIRQKSAGLRTHTLVGLAAALIMLVSKYGFADILGNQVVLTRPGSRRRSYPASGSSATA